MSGIRVATSTPLNAERAPTLAGRVVIVLRIVAVRALPLDLQREGQPEFSSWCITWVWGFADFPKVVFPILGLLFVGASSRKTSLAYPGAVLSVLDWPGAILVVMWSVLGSV